MGEYPLENVKSPMDSWKGRVIRDPSKSAEECPLLLSWPLGTEDHSAVGEWHTKVVFKDLLGKTVPTGASTG